jgi:hypothetical protein
MADYDNLMQYESLLLDALQAERRRSAAAEAAAAAASGAAGPQQCSRLLNWAQCWRLVRLQVQVEQLALSLGCPANPF